jgi:putative inorganic carbon (hco3(-)) transporter
MRNWPMGNAHATSVGISWTTVLVSGLAVAIFIAAFKFEQLELMAVPGVAILAILFAWSQPFVVCALFIAFSYFRLAEAYPSLAAFKPALLLGIASVGLVVAKALLSELRSPVNSRTVKTLCLVSLAACIGLAVPYSLLRAAGSVGFDALMIPATMTCVAFCAVVWTVLLSAAGEHPLPFNMQLFSVFFILICITTIFSRVPGDSFDWWSTITWRVAVMTFATAWLVRTERDLLHASNIFIGSGLLIAVVVIYNKIYDLSLVQGTRIAIGVVVTEGREVTKVGTATILSDPNDLALIMMFPLAFALARVIHRRSVGEGVLAAAACVTTLAAIVFTQSRGAAIGVLVVVVMLLLQRFRSAVLGLMAVVFVGSILIAAMGLDNRSAGDIDADGMDESSQHRLDAWEAAVTMAASRPLTGVGISNFPQMYYSYTDNWHNREVAAHSMWFQVLGELGVIAFAVFVAMIWSSFKVNAETIRTLQQARAPPFLLSTAVGLQAALAGICASGTFLSQAYTWPVYIITALIAALANQAMAYRVSIGADSSGTLARRDPRGAT